MDRFVLFFAFNSYLFMFFKMLGVLVLVCPRIGVAIKICSNKYISSYQTIAAIV